MSLIKKIKKDRNLLDEATEIVKDANNSIAVSEGTAKPILHLLDRFSR